jgi:hypothetical protein
MAEDEKKEEKKIIIDEDWKHEAQREKEILAEKEKLEHKEKEKPSEKRGPLPKGDFAGLISMLVTQTLYSLGMLGVEGQEENREPDLALAKYNIDMLETIEEKTKGNLSDQEKKVLENMLSQVRMAFVEASK